MAFCASLQSYPQYWQSEGSTKYGDVTLQLLSESTSKNITTRKFSVMNKEVQLKSVLVEVANVLV